LREVLMRTVLFARLDPNQKARVVRVLREMGNTVGFLGDGINDALALRESDVGVSVDSGADLAKDAADIILTEKSLDVLHRALVFGRITHGNTIKYIKMTASSNFGNVFSMIVASAWLPFLPMMPIHILCQNLIYEISQIAIPWDNMDSDYLEKPKKWEVGNIGFFMACIGPTSSLFDVTWFCIGWFYYGWTVADGGHSEHSFQTCWFLLGTLTQTLIVHMIRTDKLPFLQSTASIYVIIMTLALSGVGLAIPNISGIAGVLSMVPPPSSFYVVLFLEIFAYIIVTQIAKKLYIWRFHTWL